MTTRKPKAESVETVEEPSRRTPGRAASAAAHERLRQAHREEFEGYLKEERESRGLEYVRALTAEEKLEKAKADRLAKAQAKQEALYREFPELRPAESPEAEGV